MADAGEEIGALSFRVEARELGGLDDGLGVGEDLAARFGADEEVIGILLEMLQLRSDGSDYVFPGRRGRPLSGMATEMLLRRMKLENVTVHGFRPSFREWVSEETNFPREIAEAALAHVVGDATERAYRRSDALERRRELIEARADFLGVGMMQAPSQSRVEERA